MRTGIVKLLRTAMPVLLLVVGCGSDLGDNHLFVSSRGSAPDSFVQIVRVDGYGDTLALELRRYLLPEAEHIRIYGPFGGAARDSRPRLWGRHRLVINAASQEFASREDLCTQGGGSTIDRLNVDRVRETCAGIDWEESWWFRTAGAYSDSFEVARTITARSGDPYFLVRYDLTYAGAAEDSFRLCWYSQPRVSPGGSRHDVGFAPGYGPVYTSRTFRAADTGYWAGIMNIGNPLACHVDTVLGGRSSHFDDRIKVDFGSGFATFAAGFICFNPAREIVPFEYAWLDVHPREIASLHSDSSSIRLDQSSSSPGVYGSMKRFFLARTVMVRFVPGETKTLEYAVGRCHIEDRCVMPVFPVVTFLDGSKSSCVRRPGPDDSGG